MNKPSVVVFSLSLLLTSGSFAAEPSYIYTGSEAGSYFNDFGPVVRDVLHSQVFTHELKTTAGTTENYESVLAHPSHVGLGQFDVVAALEQHNPGQVAIVRDDIAMECLYAVVQEEKWQNWGDVVKLARRMQIALPAEKSGSSGSFRFIQSLDPDLQRARKIDHYASAKEAVTAVMAGQAHMAFFVQFANTDNEVFKAVNESGLRFVPVLSRNMLRVEVDGKRVYRPVEVKVKEGGWFEKGTALRTACTPMVVFTGQPGLFPDGSNDRLDQEDLIAALKGPSSSEFRPKKGWLTNVLDNMKEMSGEAVEDMMEEVDKAIEG